MRAWFRHIAGLLALASAVSAPGQAPSDLAGVYVANRMETATALELAADGRFAWVFSMGALDVAAHGRWRRDGDAVLLDSDPVTAPAFEIVATEPAPDRVVRIRFDADSRSAIGFVDIVLEYADGARAPDRLRGTGYAIALGGERPVVAFRLVSAPFQFQSQRFPVPAEGASITFRFVPNDLGTEDFRGQRLVVAADGLTLGWRGETLQYARVGPPTGEATRLAERGSDAADAAPAGEELPPPPPSEPWEVSESMPSLGLIDYVLDEPFAATVGRSTLAFPDRLGGDGAPGVAGLRVRIGDRVHDFGRVSGLGWRVDEGEQGNRIGTFDFSAQDRMLALGEALDRARAIQAWLAQAGFVQGVPEGSDLAPFQLIDPYRYTEQAAGWDEAATILADEDQGISGMELFMMRARGWYAHVSVMNYSRVPDGFDTRSPGREWVLQVSLFRDTDTDMTAMDDAP